MKGTMASPLALPAKSRSTPAHPSNPFNSSGRRRKQPQMAAPVAAMWPWDTFNSGSKAGNKLIHCLRHGETQMNVHLGLCSPAYGEPGFRDPLLFDTRLTFTGRAQASQAAAQVAMLSPIPEVVVVSPLTRALQTTDIAFDGLPWPRLVNPLAAERLYLSSDVGRPREQLKEEFPHYGFEELPQGRGRSAAWWHTGDSDWSEEEEESMLAIVAEPEGAFLQRVERLRQWLEARPERSIALVSHWAVLRALTGRDFENCELRTVRLGQLRARPHLLRQEAASA